MRYVGVDISKDTFDAHEQHLGNRKFSNDLTGINAFKRWIADNDTHVVMEASGPYYLRLAHELHQAQVRLSVINPLVIRRFCQMNLQRAKTDRKDAQSISQFGILTSPSIWSPSPAHLQQLIQLQSVTEQLSKQLTSTRNALEALLQNPGISKGALKSLRSVERIQQEQITELEKQSTELTKQYYQSEFNSLISIPGIGKKTAMLLIITSDGFSRFEKVKQFIAYTGIAPRIFQSGKTINRKPKISKLGMSDLRRSLFMCSLQAIKCNEGCKRLYDRMRLNGKAAKVALMAVANKLIRQAFAVVKKKVLYKSELSLA